MSKILKSSILVLILIAIAFWAFYYYRDNILKLYENTSEGLSNLNKTDFQDALNEIKKEVFTPSPLNIGGASNNSVLTKEKIIAQTNFQRYDNGTLTPLIENQKLNQVALAKANDMFKNQYFEHVSPSLVGPGDLAKSFEYDYVLVGENLILGNFKDEKEVVELWMNSPGHRANILNERFTEIGVAIVRGTYNGKTAWIGVQEFGLPLSACEQPNLEVKNQIEVSQSMLEELSVKIDLKKEEIENTNKKSNDYSKKVDEYNKLVGEYNALSQEIKNLILQYNNQVNVFNQCVEGS